VSGLGLSPSRSLSEGPASAGPAFKFPQALPRTPNRSPRPRSPSRDRPGARGETQLESLRVACGNVSVPSRPSPRSRSHDRGRHFGERVLWKCERPLCSCVATHEQRHERLSSYSHLRRLRCCFRTAIHPCETSKQAFVKRGPHMSNPWRQPSTRASDAKRSVRSLVCETDCKLALEQSTVSRKSIHTCVKYHLLRERRVEQPRAAHRHIKSAAPRRARRRERRHSQRPNSFALGKTPGASVPSRHSRSSKDFDLGAQSND
jgi:hypothetical protein